MQSVCKNIFAFISLEDVSTIFIDKTNLSDPTKKETFWIYKHKTWVPSGLNGQDGI